MGKRSYRQFCGLAKGLDVVGERWTLLIVRELLLGPRRYSQLMQGLPGITTNLLAARLVEMVDAGLIEKTELSQPASGHAYQLTAMGRELEPVVLAIGRFGQRYLDQGPGKGDRLNVGWAMVSLKRRYTRPRGRACVRLVLEGRSFRLKLGGEQLEVSENDPREVDAELVGSLALLRGLFFESRALSTMAKQRGVTISGDESALQRFCSAFDLTR